MAYAVLPAAITILVVALSACSRSSSALKIDTEYTSVFLDNGQIFVGKLEKVESSYVLLKDVFYIKSWVVQDKEDQSRQIKNTISLRSEEANNPSYTYISTQHILVIEPVSANSKISELVRKAKAEKSATP